MKVLDFPKGDMNETDDKKDALDFVDACKDMCVEEGVVKVVMVFETEDGIVGVATNADMVRAKGLLSIAIAKA